MEAPLASTQTSSWAFEGGCFQDPDFHNLPHRADSKSVAGVVLRFDARGAGAWGDGMGGAHAVWRREYASPRDALEPAWSALASPK